MISLNQAQIEDRLFKKRHAGHSRAKVETSLRHINSKIEKLNCKWLSVEAKDRKVILVTDTDILQELSRFEGCYVITADLSADVLSADQVHAHYKYLAKVERAWDKIDVTMQEGLNCLASLSSVEVCGVGKVKIEQVPKPKDLSDKLLEALKITLPTKIICSNVNVSTKVKTGKRR